MYIAKKTIPNVFVSLNLLSTKLANTPNRMPRRMNPNCDGHANQWCRLPHRLRLACKLTLAWSKIVLAPESNASLSTADNKSKRRPSTRI